MMWISVEEALPEDESKEYLCTRKNGCIDIYGFTKDAYRFDKYDFRRYIGKKKALFYNYDRECGYIEENDVVAWMPLPEPYEEKK